MSGTEKLSTNCPGLGRKGSARTVRSLIWGLLNFSAYMMIYVDRSDFELRNTDFVRRHHA